MLLFRQHFTFFADQSTPLKMRFLGTISPPCKLQRFSFLNPVTTIKSRHFEQIPMIVWQLVRSTRPFYHASSKPSRFLENWGFWGL
jgi:hypothetical protein